MRANSWLSHERYPIVLFALLVVFAAAMAIAPHNRADWALENALLFAAVGALVALRRTLPLSRVSYTLIFLFCCLHTVGAHYTYSEVPYQAWLAALTGWSPAGRNQYDRFVHFAYGLLLAYPIREVFLRVADVRGFWGYYLPLDVTMATSMIYELIEWAAAVVLGGELGAAYLGSQGDPWDAQKDMALATAGACMAMLVTALLNWRFQRDFAREWAESLQVKHAHPLGEDELRRLMRESR
jgi:putative membrane protein